MLAAMRAIETELLAGADLYREVVQRRTQRVKVRGLDAQLGRLLAERVAAADPQLTVAAAEGTVAGTVLGLDSDGALLLQEGNSRTPRRLLAGDVTVVGGYTYGVRS